MEIIAKKTNQRPLFWAIFLLLTSLAIRLEYRSTLIIDNPIMKDAYYLYACAYNIAKHNVFSNEPTFKTNIIPRSNSFLAPGFPYLLASALKIDSITQNGFYNIATLYNAVLGSFIAPMVFYICLQFITLYSAIAATLLIVFSPHLISIGGYLLTETLFSFLLLSTITCLIVSIKNKSMFFYSISGFLMGLAYLSNPVVFFLPFLLVASLCLNILKRSANNNLWLYLKPVVVYLFFFLTIVGCWEIRNYISVGSDAPSSNGRAVINLINGLYPDYHDALKEGRSKNSDYLMNKDISRAEGSLRKAIEIVYERVAKEPVKYLKWYIIEKPLVFWSWNIHIGTGDIYVYPVRQSLFSVSYFWGNIKLIFKYINPLLTFINIIGLGLLSVLIRKGAVGFHIMIVSVVLIYSTLMYTIFYPDPRYSIPFRPFYYIFSVWTLHILTERFRGFLGLKDAI